MAQDIFWGVLGGIVGASVLDAVYWRARSLYWKYRHSHIWDDDDED